jgi:4-amino-4-deoxy-L-arabinose transferase-like glycosyltransferase
MTLVRTEPPWRRHSLRYSVVLVIVVAVAARLAVLLVERGAILETFVEKSDAFAQTLLESRTYGFVPGHPSAYTQPLYGWFLAGLYWAVGRHWFVVGLSQTIVAAMTALVVLYIGRRFLSPRAGLLAALASTVHPYIVWHDVHVNREILDQFTGAVVFLLVLLVAEKKSPWLGAALGVILGLAILGDTRLVLLPLLVAVFLLFNRVGRVAVAVCLVLSAFTVAPWVIRNKVQVGCFAITTDGARALWKANNVNTYATLEHGGWIDGVPPLPDAPPSAQDAWEEYVSTGAYTPVNECAQTGPYTHATISFWQRHPGDKAALIQQAVRRLWDPRPTETDATTHPAFAVLPEVVYALGLFALALRGVGAVPRRFLALGLLFLMYETLMAALFTGATRYRVPWDFVLALFAAAAIERYRDRRGSSVRRLRQQEPATFSEISS